MPTSPEQYASDLENDAARLAAMLNSDECQLKYFDHGYLLAAFVRWGDLKQAELVRIARKKQPLASDFRALAEKLRAWKEHADQS